MKTLDDIKELTKFVPSWHETGSCLDLRHILFLYEILKRTGVKRTLEIGTHSGCSASAFVAAGVPDAHFADITRRADAMSVIQGHGTFHQRKGCDVIRDEDPFDLIFVDGRHDLEAVQEEWAEIMNKPPAIIVAHDVNSTESGFPYCEGAKWLWDTLHDQGWWTCTDFISRPDELTCRGLMVACMRGGPDDLDRRIWEAVSFIA